jgi:hypothetical protein
VLTAALPFLVTVIVAVALSLLLSSVFAPQQPTHAVSISATNTPRPNAPTTTLPAATPTSTALISEGSADLLRLEVADLRAENRHIWSVIYLLRTAVQLDDAATALRINDLNEVERLLSTARLSLDEAYRYGTEQDKGPIDTFRSELSAIREDLRVRPEGVDQRLAEVRRLVLSLVEED